MSETLQIFGEQFTDVTGIKAYKPDGTEVVFRSDGYTGDEILHDNALSGNVVAPTITVIVDFAMYYKGKNESYSVYAPEVTWIGQNAFRNNTKLVRGVFPKVSSYNGTSYIFYGCSSLVLLDWGVANIPANFLTTCGKIKTIILRKSSAIATLNNINTFTSTPFASGKAGGTIYIPKALYDHLGDGTALDYQSATNWSTIHGYGTITWAQLEGSPYESTSWWESEI